MAWIGPVVAERTLLACHDAFSPAGVRWNNAFVTALVEAGSSVFNVYQSARRSWPYGPMSVGGSNRDQLPGITTRWVPYLNISPLREMGQRMGYCRALEGQIKQGRKPDWTIIYNPLPHQVAAAAAMFRRYGIRWIYINADWYRSNISVVRCEELGVSGHVFLSWDEYQKCSCRNKLHLDGGISVLKCSLEARPPRNKNVVYTGKMTALGGVEILIRAFRRVQHPQAKFFITGAGWTQELARIAGEDTRVTYLGLVSSERLDEVCRGAEVFVNPRPSDILENAANFPSKLLEYLSWGKPIVSTFTKGLHPDYREVLTVYAPETEERLAKSIDDVLYLSDDHYFSRCNTIAKWAAHEKMWSRQSARLLSWLDGLTDGGRTKS